MLICASGAMVSDLYKYKRTANTRKLQGQEKPIDAGLDNC
jgi:hypothetical protein